MDLSATVVITRRPAEVFAYVMDVVHDADWRTGVVEAAFTSREPHGLGSTGFDKIDGNGREMISTWTILEYEPGSLARWSLDSGPISGTGGYVCREHPEGTHFTLEAQVKPTGAFRLLGPIFGWIGRRQNAADVLKLKSVLEPSST